ncbi:extracellular solute-binding protein, partial [Thioclava sp. BHET1]
PDPIPQLKMSVDTNTKLFDVGLLNPEHILRLHDYGNQYLLPMQLENLGDMANYVPHTFGKDYAGVAIYALAMGYRSDTFSKNPPTSWQDFWDYEKFKGRRGLWRSPVTTLEMALVADGVPLDKLYPLDVDRAFKSLDKIKDHIDVWWTSGAQNTQVLQNGEVDLTATWSTRAQAAINDGAPVEIVWNGGLYNIDAWTIPGNNDQPELARKFVEFTMDPKRQSVYTEVLAAGPTNMKAYDYIDAKLAKVLPTAPDHIKGPALLDAG